MYILVASHQLARGMSIYQSYALVFIGHSAKVHKLMYTQYHNVTSTLFMDHPFEEMHQYLTTFFRFWKNLNPLFQPVTKGRSAIQSELPSLQTFVAYNSLETFVPIF